MNQFNKDHEARYFMSEALANLGFCAMMIYGMQNELDEKMGIYPLFSNLDAKSSTVIEMLELSQ